MRQVGIEYAPAGFYAATGDGSDGRGQMRHQSHCEMQHQWNNQTSAPSREGLAQSSPPSQHLQLHTDQVQPNKRRRLGPESTQRTIIDRALTRADDTHRKSNGWPAMPPPDMDLPQFVNPRDLMLRPVTPRSEFNWDNNFLFQSRVFEQHDIVPVRPIGRPMRSRKQPTPSTSRSNRQAVGHVGTPGATGQKLEAPPKIVQLPGVIAPPRPPPRPPRQQQHALPEVLSFNQSAPLMLEERQYESGPAAAPHHKRRDSGAQLHLDGSNDDIEPEPVSPTTSAYTASQTRPYPRNRTMSLTSDSGSIYSDYSARSNSPAPAPSSTAASSPPKPLPTPKKAPQKTNPPTPNQPAPMKKKKGKCKYIQPSRQTTHLPHSPPPNVQFIPGTRPLPTEISTLVQRLKSATRKENFPQRTSLRRFDEFDSRYGYLKRSSVLWKEWFGDTRLFTEKWWRFFAMTGKGQELGRGDEEEEIVGGGNGHGDGDG
ncbi:hypothetical protein AC579_8838 [Pseudocercospora musae]|uniref:Uncharacterized protein n=1 Tax=Pseudocercospora musae TaxID=113226 RepID=A0A139IGX8_9PEZI|nr:hypothetical protein AC579_8838 [Pseudocercospora musae]